MDKDHDGGISFSELHRWINERAAKEGNPWTMLLSHPEIIEIAHEQAVKTIEHSDVKYVIHKKVVDIATFRSLLLQLFAISIIWVHFKKADNHATNEGYDEKLNFHEFSRAVKTFSAAYGQEEIPDLKLFEDFCTLDKDQSGGITFAEVSVLYYVLLDGFVRGLILTLLCCYCGLLCAPAIVTTTDDVVVRYVTSVVDSLIQKLQKSF